MYVCARGWMRSVHQFLLLSSVLGFTGIAPKHLNCRFSSGDLSSVLSSTSFIILIVLPLSPLIFFFFFNLQTSPEYYLQKNNET